MLRLLVVCVSNCDLRFVSTCSATLGTIIIKILERLARDAQLQIHECRTTNKRYKIQDTTYKRYKSYVSESTKCDCLIFSRYATFGHLVSHLAQQRYEYGRAQIQIHGLRYRYIVHLLALRGCGQAYCIFQKHKAIGYYLWPKSHLSQPNVANHRN